MAAPPGYCDLIGRQIAAMMDKQMPERPRPEGRRDGDGGAWLTVSRLFERDYGPNVEPRSNRETLTLRGKVSSYAGGGRELATLAERSVDQTEIAHRMEMIMLNKGNERVPGINFKGWTEAEKENWFAVLDGRTHEVDEYGLYIHPPGSMNVAPITDRVAQATRGSDMFFKDSFDELARAQPVVFSKPRPGGYAPMIHESALLNRPENAQRITEGLSHRIAKQNGRATPNVDDVAAARLMFDLHANTQHSVAGAHLMRDPLWDIGEGRLMDPQQALELFSKQKQRMIQESRVWGPRDAEHRFPERAREMMKSISEANPNDRSVDHRVSMLMEDTLGIIASDPFFNNAIIKMLNGAQGFKLSASVFKNMSQTGNTLMMTDGRAVLEAINALAINSEAHTGIPAREFRQMMGSVVDEAMYSATLWPSVGRIGRVVEGVLNITGFTPVEKFNRSVAGLAGAFYAERQAAQYANTGRARYANQLREFGINPEKAVNDWRETGSLALEDKLLAGQKTINATQFRARQADLPFFATHNPSMWRALLTFRTFALNQVRFMIDEGAKRPVRTAMFGMAVMPAIGYGVNFLHDFVYQDIIGAPQSKAQASQDAISNYLEAASAAGSWGYISDALYTASMSGQSQAFKNFLLPAMLSSAQDYLTVGGQLARGNFKQAWLTTGRQLGGLGAAFSRLYDPFEEQ